MNGSMQSLMIEALYLEGMLSHVLACLPEEACGLLGGQILEGTATVQLVIPMENALHSAVRFRMDPIEQLAAFLRLDQLGLELVGIFHSHPNGPDTPSPTDLAEFYYPGTPFLIWAPRRLSGGDHWRVEAFHITDGAAEELLIQSIVP